MQHEKKNTWKLSPALPFSLSLFLCLYLSLYLHIYKYISFFLSLSPSLYLSASYSICTVFAFCVCLLFLCSSSSCSFWCVVDVPAIWWYDDAQLNTGLRNPFKKVNTKRFFPTPYFLIHVSRFLYYIIPLHFLRVSYISLSITHTIFPHLSQLLCYI